jgi:hypothetical protein
VVRELVQAHGGTVQAAGQPGPRRHLHHPPAGPGFGHTASQPFRHGFFTAASYRRGVTVRRGQR